MKQEHLDRIDRFFEREHWGQTPRWFWPLIAVGVLAASLASSLFNSDAAAFAIVAVLTVIAILFFTHPLVEYEAKHRR